MEFQPDPFPAAYRIPVGATEASSAFQDAQARIDGWENALTGVGTLSRDKQQSLAFCRPYELTFDWITLQNLYHFDPLSRRIIDTWPEHMFRNGWDLAITGETDKAQSSSSVLAINKDVKRLDLVNRLYKGMTWGDLFGGALVIVGANDGQADLSKPLNEANIQSIDYINVIDRRFTVVKNYYADYKQPNHGEPMIYSVFNSLSDINSPNAESLFEIHESRTIRFEGAPVDPLERRRLQGWAHSRLQAPYEEIKRFMQVFQSASHLLTDASQGVYKLKGLMQQLVTPQGQALLQTRMQMMDMARSVARSLLIDADGEEFARIQTSFASIPELMDRFMQMLSMVTRIPVTVLMGRSAAGMNATGDSDFRSFYGEVKVAQKNNLKPKLERAYRLVMLARSGPTKGKVLDLDFDFCPLWDPTDKERADTNYVQAQADALNVTSLIYTPEEIAISRSANPGRFNPNMIIDVAGRESAIAAGTQFIEPEAIVPDTGASDKPNTSGNASSP